MKHNGFSTLIKWKWKSTRNIAILAYRFAVRHQLVSWPDRIIHERAVWIEGGDEVRSWTLWIGGWLALKNASPPAHGDVMMRETKACKHGKVRQ